MITNKKEFFGGVILMVAFIIVLIIMFSPVFGGMNGLDYLDNLYNSISKGSANYIAKVKEETDAFNGTDITVTLDLEKEEKAEKTAALFNYTGALVNVSGPSLKVSGDLGKILANCLSDSDLMYHNKGADLQKKYGTEPKMVMYLWWKAMKELEKDLKRQKFFKEASMPTLVKKKAVETAYNYYGIEPQSIGDKIGIVIFSLVFYVVYTLWYGFAIMYMFEGYGMQLEH
jgi:ABC-type Na+ efflux pump permease subunit